MSVILCFFHSINDSASCDRWMEGFSVLMGSVISLFDMAKLMFAFTSAVSISDEIKLEVLLLTVTMVIWFCHLKSGHSDMISGTLIFELAQLIIEILKHIIVVQYKKKIGWT